MQNSDLDSTILRAAGGSLVIGDGLGITKSKGLNQPPQIQTMHANQVLIYGLRASFAQGPVFGRIAGGVRKAHYFNQPTVGVPLGLLALGPRCRVIDCLPGSGVNDAAVYFEVYRDCANGFRPWLWRR